MGNSLKYYELPYNPLLRDRARELRKTGNLSEALLQCDKVSDRPPGTALESRFPLHLSKFSSKGGVPRRGEVVHLNALDKSLTLTATPNFSCVPPALSAHTNQTNLAG